MQLTLNGLTYEFMALGTFRAQWNLPDEFCVAAFAVKEWSGLGKLDGNSGPGLAQIKQALVQAVPHSLTVKQMLLTLNPMLTEVFCHELVRANHQIGLREVEVEFAVAGFYDVLQATAYRLIHLNHEARGDLARLRADFDFATVYQRWLDGSARVATQVSPYTQGDMVFKVQVVSNPYGRIGLAVTVNELTYYVSDPALACPAANFMRSLCEEVVQAMCEALTL
jgi:hypothetical protein